MVTKALALSDNRKLEIANYLKSFQANIGGSEIQKALALVEQGFDPFLHLVVYQGKVTTTIDALYWWADGKGIPYRVISKPIKAEEKEPYGVGENEIGVIANLYVSDAIEPSFTGFGRASKDAKSPVQKGSFVEHQHPYRMAEKRAEAQVLRKFRALATSVPIMEEAIDGELVPENQAPPGEAPEPIEKKRPVAAKPAMGPTQGAVEDTSKSEELPSPTNIRNLGQLFEAAQKHFKMSQADVIRELGVSKKESIADVGDAWNQILEMRKGPEFNEA